MSEQEQTGIVLGKLAEPYPDGLVCHNWGAMVTSEEISRISRQNMMFSSAPTYHDDPLYFAAENKRKRRRV